MLVDEINLCHGRVFFAFYKSNILYTCKIWNCAATFETLLKIWFWNDEIRWLESDKALTPKLLRKCFLQSTGTMAGEYFGRFRMEPSGCVPVRRSVSRFWKKQIRRKDKTSDQVDAQSHVCQVRALFRSLVDGRKLPTHKGGRRGGSHIVHIIVSGPDKCIQCSPSDKPLLQVSPRCHRLVGTWASYMPWRSGSSLCFALKAFADYQSETVWSRRIL